ncbi:MAG TPA: carboxypeptidase-like regulatory domain-containing protein [Pirellulales bacterium]|jgi:hypothetical protein|nr:carboxypeptidase-like regulatory domain-containing protein [Pirellulales bacterium]
MKRSHWLTRTAVGLALIGSLVPDRRVLAQAPTPPPAQTEAASAAANPVTDVTDIALTEGGGFAGQVVDAQGRPQAGTSIMVCQQHQVVATTTTDAQGQFSLRGLHGGVYQVVAGQGMKNVRLWAPGTAPPAARQSALVVASVDVVRGQGGLRYWLTNPWVLAVAITAAIAVPIALSNREKSAASG